MQTSTVKSKLAASAAVSEYFSSLATLAQEIAEDAAFEAEIEEEMWGSDSLYDVNDDYMFEPYVEEKYDYYEEDYSYDDDFYFNGRDDYAYADNYYTSRRREKVAENEAGQSLGDLLENIRARVEAADYE